MENKIPSNQLNEKVNLFLYLAKISSEMAVKVGMLYKPTKCIMIFHDC